MIVHDGKSRPENLLAVCRKYRFIFERLTPRRLLNALTACLEARARRTQLRSRPVLARINTCPHCNLRCPGCMGREDYQQRGSASQHMMRFEEYRHVLDQVSDTVLLVLLYDEGEPLLNPDLTRMIRYTHRQNIATSISTNFSVELSDRGIEDLVLSGLDHLKVSLDGMSDEVYERYRVNGNLDLVKSNLRRVVAAKTQHRRKRPIVEVQYINFGYNGHQIGDARAFAQAAGVDVFSSFQSLPDYHWLRYDGPEAVRAGVACSALWMTIDVSSDGTVYPCDYGEDNGMAPVGSMLETEFGELWNGREMRHLRRSFRRERATLGAEQCRSCPLTQALPILLR